MYLSFSDAAKFADVARNVINGYGYISNFDFSGTATSVTNYFSSVSRIPPITPISMAIFFKFFGINDLAVIATSFFYFVLTIIFVYLLAAKVFKSTLTGILSAVAVGFNHDLINYATNGSSESLFIFEIVSSIYFLSLNKKWSSVVGFLLLVMMYFTRQQAFIYIFGIIFYWLLTRFGFKKATVYLFGLTLFALIFDSIIHLYLSGKYFLYSVVGGGLNISTKYLPNEAVSDTLRGDGNSLINAPLVTFGKKMFYNLYNFYKLLPSIINPYLFALFFIGMFKWGKDKIQNSFKLISIFVVLLTLFVTAASIPFFRYIHPVIPFVYIVATATLIEIVSEVGKEKINIFKFKIPQKSFILSSSLILISIFAIGQTLGMIFLDSRFVAKRVNKGMPPVYAQLSYIIKDNTDLDNIVVTNLDTWGTWYGERKTVWFPLEPKQLINPETGEIPFDAIYLTSYRIDDENYYMGDSWRQIFNNPESPEKWICEKCDRIAEEFSFKGLYKFSGESNYERQNASAVLLIRK